MKELTVIALSTWKFAATFPVAIYAFKMSFFQTILYTNIGGFIGIIFFAFLSEGFLRIIRIVWPGKSEGSKRSKKIFTKRNRRIIYLKNKLALPGVVILTPVLLSIPVGVFIVTRYFGHKKINFLYIAAVQFLWSVIFTMIYFNIKKAF